MGVSYTVDVDGTVVFLFLPRDGFLETSGVVTFNWTTGFEISDSALIM